MVFLQLQDLALHVHRDLARQVAARHRGGHLGDVAHLAGEVGRHRVDRVGQVLPGAGHARHDRLAAELALGADLARHARDLGGERTQLIDHRIDGLLQLQNLAAHVDRDLARQVAVGDRDRDFGDVAHLAGQVAGHRIDAVGQILPGTGESRHRRLAAELAFGADLARHARDFRGEGAHLLDHRVDDRGRAQELALERPAVDLERHGLRQIALGDRGDRAGHFGRRPQQVVDQRIDASLHRIPGAAAPVDRHAMPGLALLADGLADALELERHLLVGQHDLD